jgi:aryl-alcohol dehydrogenase-like predicted oxidoreductase
MRHRTLGRTGLAVSEIAHGLWGMGSWSDSDDAQSANALQLATDLGCNFFDSAWAYGEGRSDRLLGQHLKSNGGKKLFAASKVPPLNRKWPARSSYKYSETYPKNHVLASVDLIREALQQDAIDLLQFHVWDDSWAREAEFRETVEYLKSSGRVRAFGISLNRWEPANGIAAIRTGLVDSVQVIYNIFDQSPEDELFPVCEEFKVGVIARVPLDEGSLGGKLTERSTFPPNDWRSSYFNPHNLKATIARVEALKGLLSGGMTLPQMALRFILSSSIVTTTIIGMRKPQHVRENMSISDAGPLDASLLQELKKHRWDRVPDAKTA